MGNLGPFHLQIGGGALSTLRITTPRPLPWQVKLRRLVAGRDPETGVKLEVRPRFILAAMGRRAGKTVACAEIAGNLALNVEGSRVFWGAPVADLTNVGHEIFTGPLWTEDERGRRRYSMYEPVIRKSRVQPLEATLINGSRIYWRSLEGKSAGIGRGIRLEVIDEAARVNRDVVDRDLKYALMDSRGIAIAPTTPEGQRNWTYDWYMKAKEGNPLYAYVQGPSTENPNPEVKAFVEQMRDDVGEDDPLYRQEVLAEFLADAASVFTGYQECATLPGWRDEPVEGGQYVLGVDLGSQQDWTRIVAIEAWSGECHGAWGGRGMPYPVVVRQLVEIHRKWGGRAWVDATGLGSPVVDDIRQAGVPCVPVVFTAQLKRDLVQSLRIAIARQHVRFPQDPVLLGEMQMYRMGRTPSGMPTYSAPPRKHDDFVTALMLANWARVQGTAWWAGHQAFHQEAVA